MKIGIIAVVGAALLSAYLLTPETVTVTQDSDYETLFMNFCQKYGKSYADKTEYVMRLKNFIKSYKYVSSH